MSRLARGIRTVLASVVCLGFGTAYARDFTFTANGAASGVWHAQENWEEDGTGDEGVPQINDTATIPNGKTCQVDSGSQAAKQVTVQNGGMLEVIADLEVGENLSSGAVLTVASGGLVQIKGGVGSLILYGDVTLNDSIEFHTIDNQCPTILLQDDVTVSGTGFIEGFCGPTAGADIVDEAANWSLTLEDGITLKNWGGKINIAALINNGDVLVTGEDLISTLFEAVVSGSGTYTISDGAILTGDPGECEAQCLDTCAPSNVVLAGETGTWIIDGGEWQFFGTTDECFADELNFKSGTFRLSCSAGNFTHCGKFEFGGDEDDDFTILFRNGRTIEVGRECE